MLTFSMLTRWGNSDKPYSAVPFQKKRNPGLLDKNVTNYPSKAQIINLTPFLDFY